MLRLLLINTSDTVRTALNPVRHKLVSKDCCCFCSVFTLSPWNCRGEGFIAVTTGTGSLTVAKVFSHHRAATLRAVWEITSSLRCNYDGHFSDFRLFWHLQVFWQDVPEQPVGRVRFSISPPFFLSLHQHRWVAPLSTFASSTLVLRWLFLYF